MAGSRRKIGSIGFTYTIIIPIHILKGMFFHFNLKPNGYVVKEIKG